MSDSLRENRTETIESPSPPPPRPTVRNRPGPTPADRQFLPAALEILDTPPSPIGLALLSAICVLVCAALAWSWFGRIDVVAIAAGKIQPTGRVKVIQPLETGRVVTLAVAAGQRVALGDLLMSLDSREAQADVDAVTNALASARAETLRRRRALEVMREPTAAVKEPDWDAGIPLNMREREARILHGDLGRLAAELGSLDARRLQKVAEVERLGTTIAAQQRLLATQDIRIDMRTQLVERQAGSRAQLLDAEEARQAQDVNLRTQEGQLAEARAAITVLERDGEQIRRVFVADNVQRLAESERNVDELTERLVKARTRLEAMTITAPLAGTVTALAVTGAGQVVAAGEEILRIVPEDSRLELEAYMPNRDIGFVRERDHAVIKIDSFPYTRFGTLQGSVEYIARDAVTPQDLQGSLTSPAHAPRTNGIGGTQSMQNLVFPVTIRLDRQSIDVDGHDLPLSAGMTAQAEIRTGERRILEYLFSPLVDIGSSALRER